MEDAELMTLLRTVRQRNSRRALNRLLEGVRPYLVRCIRGQVDSHPSPGALAEELAQKCLYRVARSITGCRAQSGPTFRAWLRTIAKNVVNDRHRRREGELERRTWTDVGELEHRLVHAVFPEARNSSMAVDRLIGRILWQAQGVLSEGTRRVVYRKIQFEETWAETGAAIPTTAGGAKRRWQRAQERLRSEVKERISDLPADVQARVQRRLGLSDDH